MLKSQIPIPKSQYPVTKNAFRLLFFIVCAFPFAVSVSGCETVKEGAKGFLGISTRSVEDARRDAITKSFNYDYSTCYAKTQEALKRMRAYTYAQDAKKQMIAVYVSEWDTTPVGIFFKEIDANNTQVEVSSVSTYAKEFISGKLFAVLDKELTLEELEAQIVTKEAKEKEAREKTREAEHTHR